MQRVGSSRIGFRTGCERPQPVAPNPVRNVMALLAAMEGPQWNSGLTNRNVVSGNLSRLSLNVRGLALALGHAAN